MSENRDLTPQSQDYEPRTPAQQRRALVLLGVLFAASAALAAEIMLGEPKDVPPRENPTAGSHR